MNNIVHSPLISELQSTAAWCGWAQLVVVRGGCRASGERWPAELQSCHGMQPPYTPQSGHTSSSLPTSLKIIVKKPHNLNLINSVLSSRYLWSGSGTDSEANSSSEWLVLGTFSCSPDLAEGLAIYPHLSLNFNVQTVSGWLVAGQAGEGGDGVWPEERGDTPGCPRLLLLHWNLELFKFHNIQRRCLLAPVLKSVYNTVL